MNRYLELCMYVMKNSLWSQCWFNRLKFFEGKNPHWHHDSLKLKCTLERKIVHWIIQAVASEAIHKLCCCQAGSFWFEDKEIQQLQIFKNSWSQEQKNTMLVFELLGRSLPACFLKVTKLFGLNSGTIIHYVSWKQRRFTF